MIAKGFLQCAGRKGVNNSCSVKYRDQCSRTNVGSSTRCRVSLKRPTTNSQQCFYSPHPPFGIKNVLSGVA